MSDYQEKYQKIRKQLIGFATLLLVIAVIAPWIITDKLNNQIVTDPSEHTLDVINHSQNENSEAQSSLDNDDAVNMPRLSSRAEDFDKKTESVTRVEPAEKTAATSVYAKQKDKTAKIATKTESKIKSNPAPATASATTKLKLEDKKYTIQLVALKNKQKIDELTALLVLHNYDVLVIPKSPAPNQVIKLQLGPYAEKMQAEQVIIDLKNLTKLEGKILTN